MHAFAATTELLTDTTLHTKQTAPAEASALAPLRRPGFRAAWTALAGSQLVIWMNTVGAVTVIAALAGGSLLGVIGALMAIPTAAGLILIYQEVLVPRQEQH